MADYPERDDVIRLQKQILELLEANAPATAMTAVEMAILFFAIRKHPKRLDEFVQTHLRAMKHIHDKWNKRGSGADKETVEQFIAEYFKPERTGPALH